MMIKYNEKGSSLRHKSCYYMGMVDLSLKSPNTRRCLEKFVTSDHVNLENFAMLVFVTTENFFLQSLICFPSPTDHHYTRVRLDLSLGLHATQLA